MTLVSLTTDVSGITDGQVGDQVDFVTPINQNKGHIQDTLNGIQPFARISFGTAESLTIASGVITITQSNVVVDTEGGAATDNLDTIDGDADGRILFLRIASSSRQVTLRHGIDNIVTAQGDNYTITSVNQMVILINNGTNWVAALMPANAYLNLSTDSTLTIASGAVTKTRARHLLDTEGSTSDDRLDTINGGVEGDIVELQLANAARHVQLGHLSGNISLANQQHRRLLNTRDVIKLTYDGTYWNEEFGPRRVELLHVKNRWAERAAAATYAALGFAGGSNAGAGAVTNVNAADGIFARQAIASANGTFGGRVSATFNLVRGAYDPIFTVIMKPDTDITNLRVWIGLCQQQVTNADTLASGTAGYYFNFSTTLSHTNWMAVCNDGTNQSTPASVGTTLVLATKYKLQIRVVSNDNAAYFSINDGAELKVTSNFPASTIDLGYTVSEISTGTTAKGISIQSIDCEFAA